MAVNDSWAKEFDKFGYLDRAAKNFIRDLLSSQRQRIVEEVGKMKHTRPSMPIWKNSVLATDTYVRGYNDGLDDVLEKLKKIYV